MEEIWKSIDGYEGFYEVSNLGRIRSVERTIECSAGADPDRYPAYTRVIKSRILKPGWMGGKNGKNKYLGIVLSRDGLNLSCLVAGLVAKTFIPNPDNLPQVNHKDLDKTRNSVDNLEWITAVGNSHHAIVHGHWPTGERSGTAKLSLEQAQHVKAQLKLGAHQKDLADEFGVHISTIHLIKTGQNWAHA